MTHIEQVKASRVATPDLFKVAAAVHKVIKGQLNITMYNYASFTPLHTWSQKYSVGVQRF